jgi:non-lysosomal glucosylceramidase
MTWTPLRTHSGANRRAISLPVGGIGTGTVGFGGRGQLRDWELENHPAKGLRCDGTFLACRVQEDGRPPDAFLLEGELFDDEIEGALGSPVPVSGLKRLEEACFEATYPFGRVRLRDRHVPLLCSVEAWNPLVPGDAEASGLPIAALDITLTSTSARPIDASIMLSFEALVGHRLRERRDGGGSLPFIEAATGEEMATLLAGDRGLDERDEEWGTLAAAVLGPQTYGGKQWRIGRWNQGLTEMWETFLARGEPGDGLFHSAPGEALSGCLGAHRHLTPLSSATVRFVVGWHFPNRRAWIWGGPGPRGGSGPEVVGNHYCVSRRDALDAVRQAIPRLLDLRARTEAFVASVTGSDLAAAVKEAALSNLSTLRTQTFFRTADGRPYGWEGCLDDAGSCLGSCTHVWNYEYATAYLFPDLAREMRRIEFQFSTSDAGAMSFRTLLPLEERAQAFGLAAADGQFGRLISLYREWRSSGDDGFLRDLWPAARRALAFAWLPGSWDADQDGVAEGCLHNTMDVEYYGPTPIIQSWYLGALGAMAEMARRCGDSPFAETCERLQRRGATWTDAHLFNGRYYVQEIRPPHDFASLRPEVRHPSMGAEQLHDPEFQIGNGCQIDQLVGDAAARLAGLPSVFDPVHVTSALRAVHEENYVARAGWWSNPMRTFFTNRDEGHVVCSYPEGLPAHPMPYWSEVMTGFEYSYALSLIQDGQREFAEWVVSTIRNRYDGRTRSPFDEAECGHHYARAMASWGLVPAIIGFDYDGRTGTLKLAADAPRGRWPWAVNGAWGAVEVGEDIRFAVHGGSLGVSSLRRGDRELRLSAIGPLGAGAAVTAS